MPKRPREEVNTASKEDDASDQSERKTPEELDKPTEHGVKYAQLDHQEPSTGRTMKCSLPPHREVISFDNFEDFEVHYAKVHAHRCSECHKNFPTEHFLGLHIGENHDPLNEAKRARGDRIYRCFVEDCDRVCSTPQKRRMHLVDKHSFPKNYDFLIVNTGVDKRSSMLRQKRRQSLSSKKNASTSPSEPTEASTSDSETDPAPKPPRDGSNPVSISLAAKPSTLRVDEPEDSVDAITSGMSALKFVPPSVRFGRGGKRGGFSRS